jgi:hypothetical protein
MFARTIARNAGEVITISVDGARFTRGGLALTLLAGRSIKRRHAKPNASRMKPPGKSMTAAGNAQRLVK